MATMKRLVGFGQVELDDGTHIEGFRGWAVANDQDQVIAITPGIRYHLYKHQWQAQEATDRLNGTDVPEIKSIRGEDLFKVKVGQMVVSCTGPGDRPSPGLCSKVGVVVGIEKSKWGIQLEVEWDGDNQHIDGVDVLCDPAFPMGIGVYAYPSLRLAVR